MTDTKRPPLWSEDELERRNEDQHQQCVLDWEFHEDAAFHFTNGHLCGLKEACDFYEAARAKDAELIQRLVDDLSRLRIEFGRRVGQTTQTGIASLFAAEKHGFKPSNP